MLDGYQKQIRALQGIRHLYVLTALTLALLRISISGNNGHGEQHRDHG